MDAEVIVILQPVADGIGDAAQPQLQRGAVRDQLDDVSGKRPDRVIDRQIRDFPELIIRLGHVVRLGDVDPVVLPEYSRRIPVDLQQHGAGLLLHIIVK